MVKKREKEGGRVVRIVIVVIIFYG